MARLEIDWIPVPGGELWIGGGSRPEENPRHQVRLAELYLARTPVTREQYQAFFTATAHEAPSFWREATFDRAGLPATGPSYLDAIEFCRWASVASGEDIRLPTEAEWECAAKAGREVLYPWGDEPPESLPDYSRRWLDGPERVDAYPSLHPLGFLGLGENVHEWCSDWYDLRYYDRSPKEDPRGPATGKRRSSRGGAWRHKVKVSRCAARSSIPPHLQYRDYGFRLARNGRKTTGC